MIRDGEQGLLVPRGDIERIDLKGVRQLGLANAQAIANMQTSLTNSARPAEPDPGR